MVNPHESSTQVNTTPADKSPSPALDEGAIKERVEKAGTVFKRFGSLLTRQQEVLMQKLIYNDSMHIDVAEEQDGKMMQQLYTLFFAWATEEEDNKDDAEKDFDQMDEEKRAEEERKEKEKRRKREEF